MAKLNRYQSFRLGFKTNKDLQPLGGGSAEWDEYFLANPGKVLAGALALEKLGEEAIINAQGAEYAEIRRHQEVMELIAGKRHLLNDKKAVARARGEKYLKMLKAFLKRFPVDLSQPTTEEGLAASA